MSFGKVITVLIFANGLAAVLLVGELRARGGGGGNQQACMIIGDPELATPNDGCWCNATTTPIWCSFIEFPQQDKCRTTTGGGSDVWDDEDKHWTGQTCEEAN